MKRPLACFGLAFAVAELAAASLPLPTVWLAAALLLFLTGFFLCRHRRLLPLALGLLAGAACFLGYEAMVVAPVQERQGQTVRCVAVVETDCTQTYQEGMMQGTLRLCEIDGKPSNIKVRCAMFPGAAPGTRFSCDLTLAKLQNDVYRATRYARGIYLQAEYLGNYAADGRSLAPRFLLYQLRSYLSRKLRVWMPRDLGGIEAAFLLGDKSRLVKADQNSFRAAGVSHLLAVSGLHVTLLCSVFGYGLRRRRFWRPGIAAKCLLVLFYMCLVGMPVSVIRAGMVFLIGLLADFFLQPADLLTSTGIAAILMGLQNAYTPCDLGFQLSFCAVLGVQLSVKIADLLHRKMNVTDSTALKNRARALLVEAVQSVLVAVLASLATLPVLIAHGLTTSGVGGLSNLLVVWMLCPALVMGLIVLALSLLPFLDPVQHLVSMLLSVWLKTMVDIVRWCASLPLARLYLPRRYTLLVLAVLGILALAFYAGRKMRLYPIAAGVCLLASTCLAGVLQKDVVRVGVVGTAGNPCAVVTQNGSAVVIFRGGAGNVAAVEEYIAGHGALDPVLWIDLRQNPNELDFGEGDLLAMNGEPAFSTQELLDSVSADLYHNSSTNLVVLEVGTYHIAFMAGRAELSEPVAVDLFCAAGALSEDIRAETILTTTRRPAWLGEVQEERLLMGEETPTITIRPHRSVIFEEVTSFAVQ